MHGEISLESSLGVGTKAIFWIPFNKAPYSSGDSPPIDMGAIPLRLQSDLSVSDYSGPPTPGNRASSDLRQIDKENELSDEDRRKTHILVVEGQWTLIWNPCSRADISIR